MPDRRAYLAMLGKLVRPIGWLALLDWGQEPHPAGGPPLNRRILPADAGADLAATGWNVVARPAINEWMYLLVAERGATESV